MIKDLHAEFIKAYEAIKADDPNLKLYEGTETEIFRLNEQTGVFEFINKEPDLFPFIMFHSGGKHMAFPTYASVYDVILVVAQRVDKQRKELYTHVSYGENILNQIIVSLRKCKRFGIGDVNVLFNPPGGSYDAIEVAATFSVTQKLS